MTFYKGWDIYRGPDHPATGRWRAKRFGVGMSSGTLEGIQRMIDLKVADEQRERDRRMKERGDG